MVMYKVATVPKKGYLLHLEKHICFVTERKSMRIVHFPLFLGSQRVVY